MKKPLQRKKTDIEEESPRQKKERPWWARTDAELVMDRYGTVKDWYDSKKVHVDEEDRGQVIEEAVRRDPRIKNLLDMVIVKEEGIGKEGDFLLIPIYSSEKGKKIANSLRLKTNRRIKLDDYGWGVWNLIDGRKKVRIIGRSLSNRFGEDIEPVYPRLAKFLAYLQNLKLIRIVDPKR